MIIIDKRTFICIQLYWIDFRWFLSLFARNKYIRAQREFVISHDYIKYVSDRYPVSIEVIHEWKLTCYTYRFRSFTTTDICFLVFFSFFLEMIIWNCCAFVSLFAKPRKLFTLEKSYTKIHQRQRVFFFKVYRLKSNSSSEIIINRFKISERKFPYCLIFSEWIKRTRI